MVGCMIKDTRNYGYAQMYTIASIWRENISTIATMLDYCPRTLSFPRSKQLSESLFRGKLSATRNIISKDKYLTAIDLSSAEGLNGVNRLATKDEK